MTPDPETVQPSLTLEAAPPEAAKHSAYEPPALVAHGSWQMMTAAISLTIGPG